MGIENRPDNASAHREVYHAGHTSFASFVPLETALNAQFNLWEPSSGLDTGGKSSATVFLSHVDDRNPDGPLNLVVIQDLTRKHDRSGVRYFFGTFRGTPRGACETQEQIDLFESNVAHVYTRHHRVAGSELNSRIRNAARLDEPLSSRWR